MKIMALSGSKGDCVAFGEYLCVNVWLYWLKYGYELDVSVMVYYVRNEFVEVLRSGSYQVNCLFAGFDKLKNEFELYFMDYLVMCYWVNIGGYGYGGMFCLLLFDKYWVLNMLRVQVMDLVDLCVGEVCERLVIASTDYLVKIVDKNGCEMIVYDVIDWLKK